MPFWAKKDKKDRTRIFFATDVHGSEPTFRKFINAGKFYGVNVLILGGDVAGKMLIPIIEEGGNSFRATLHGRVQSLAGDELPEFQTRLAKLGFYNELMSEQDYLFYREHPAEVEKLYLEKAKERLASWVSLAEERLDGANIRCYVTGGNDDHPHILEALQEKAGSNVIPCEEKLVTIDEDGHIMISLGYSNPTPWKTPREIADEEIAKKIESAVSGISDYTRAIFNLHVPPKDSTLDTCPMLDTSTYPPTVITSGGEPVMFGAGSQAVRDAIERYQPLLSLHGHIHESRNEIKIGRTTSVNPGSEYGEGILKGAIVSLSADRVESVQMTSG